MVSLTDLLVKISLCHSDIQVFFFAVIMMYCSSLTISYQN